jgi:hypothetical protein
MNRAPRLTIAASALLILPLTAGCVTVRPPDKPIEINLNVKIEQEVLVRLQRDVDQLIRSNPDVFPTTPPPAQPQGNR